MKIEGDLFRLGIEKDFAELLAAEAVFEGQPQLLFQAEAMFYGYGGESFEVLPTILMIYNFVILVKASIDWHLFGHEKTV